MCSPFSYCLNSRIFDIFVNPFLYRPIVITQPLGESPLFPRNMIYSKDHSKKYRASHTDNPARYAEDRKSTRLNSSHRCISYAVFCLKKKKNMKRSSII